MPTNDDIKQKHSEFKRMYGFADWDKDTNAMLNQARIDSLKIAINHMRVARSSMCLKDRAILLNEINLLEIEIKKLRPQHQHKFKYWKQVKSRGVNVFKCKCGFIKEYQWANLRC